MSVDQGVIEVFKAKQGVSRINGVFRYGRSGLNLINKSSKNRTTKLESVKRNFINEKYNYFGTNYLLKLKILRI